MTTSRVEKIYDDLSPKELKELLNLAADKIDILMWSEGRKVATKASFGEAYLLDIAGDTVTLYVYENKEDIPSGERPAM